MSLEYAHREMTGKERQYPGSKPLWWYLGMGTAIAVLGYLNYDQDVLVIERRKAELTRMPRPNPIATAIWSYKSKQVPHQASAATSEVVAGTPTPPLKDNPEDWDCGLVNNPQALGFNPQLPDAPTASHVLALAHLGEPGIDDPPYLLIHKDGTVTQIDSLEGLNLVHNGEGVCAKSSP